MKKLLATVTVLTFIFFVSASYKVEATEKIKSYDEISAATFAEMEQETPEKMQEFLGKYYNVEYFPLHKTYKLTEDNDDDILIVVSPSIIKYEGKETLVYIEGNGNLSSLKIGAEFSEIKMYGSAHVDSIEGKVIIKTSIDSAITYAYETGKIEQWNRNKVEKTFEIPEESIYCGFSDDVGHIFRNNGDVYAFTEGSFFATALEEDKAVKIATDVESVLVTNYWFSEEHFGEPLFLMKDGTIKAYVNDDGNIEKMALEKYLKTPIFEGGYRE